MVISAVVPPDGSDRSLAAGVVVLAPLRGDSGSAPVRATACGKLIRRRDTGSVPPNDHRWERTAPRGEHLQTGQIIRRKGLVPPALPERFRRCGHLHDQTTLPIPDGNKVVVLVEGLCLVVHGINDDEPAAADFRCGDGFA